MSKSAVISALEKIAGRANLLTSPEDLVAYSTDGTSAGQLPLAVVTATSPGMVAEVLKYASRQRLPVTPRGSGTSLSGGAVPDPGSLVLSLSRLNRIREINPVNLTATVEAGTVTARLQQEAEKLGLYYPPTPVSYRQSTVGGNIATNAGGITGVKYGTTRDYVLGLEVVLASGEIVRTGGAVMKMVTGYNLAQLLVGSEGTLAVVTGATLRLIPKPKSFASVMASFARLEEAAQAVNRILTSGLLPCSIELMDRLTIRAVEDYLHLGLPTEAEAIILVGMDGTAESVVEETRQAAALCREMKAIRVETAATPAENEALWRARNSIGGAYGRLAPNKGNQDISVPREAMVAMIRASQEIAARHGLPMAMAGHLGDGNLHPVVLYDESRPEQVAAMHAIVDEVINQAIRLGGMPSAEHGLGTLKRQFLRPALDPRAVALMRDIKHLFDPLNILNPGKVFPNGEGGT
ncbi:MAG: FAD-linked oxidase C-terminal domain-containing protein [Chloroflexota bacterium]